MLTIYVKIYQIHVTKKKKKCHSKQNKSTPNITQKKYLWCRLQQYRHRHSRWRPPGAAAWVLTTNVEHIPYLLFCIKVQSMFFQNDNKSVSPKNHHSSSYSRYHGMRHPDMLGSTIPNSDRNPSSIKDRIVSANRNS